MISMMGEDRVAKSKTPPAAKPKPKTERERTQDRGIALATSIRVDRDEVELDQRAITDEKTGRAIQTMGDRRAYLTKHWRRGDITLWECQAGERYAADYEHSTAGVPSALDPARMEAHGGSGSARGLPPLSADPIAALTLRQATLAIGAPLAEIVVWVAVEGKGAAEWAKQHDRPARDGMAILRHALSALAQHYGRGKN